MRTIRLLICAATILGLSMLSACTEDTLTPNTPNETEDTALQTIEGQMIYHTDCKNDYIGDTESKDREKIIWSYDGFGNLSVKHINTALNTYLDGFQPEIYIEDGMIIIDETNIIDQEEGYCLFNVDYLITNIPYGNYKIKFKVPAVENKKFMKTDINLDGGTNGERSVMRVTDPWSL